ncbi:hypothetical protein [Caballeronia sp. LjRoot31]|jgi:integrase/recombinase XerD|uniref:hypothetical protein n=1 Tax=Caballeronia sp. LjRoot31 TaxID=3342324 RepID=UPI003ECC5924
MRITEIAQVTVADFYFASGELRREVSLCAAITKGCRQRRIYRSSIKLIGALRRYVIYRRERDLGTALGRTHYHGLNPHLPVVLSRITVLSTFPMPKLVQHFVTLSKRQDGLA